MEFEESNLEQSRRINDIYIKAKEEVIRSAMRKFIRDSIKIDKIDKSSIIQSAMEIIPKKYFETESRGRNKENQTYSWFITINSNDNVNSKDFYNRMLKCTSKSILSHSQSHYRIENKEYRWSIIWLVEFNTMLRKGIITQQIYQCFKQFVNQKSNIYIKPIFNKEQWNEYLVYIEGEETK